MTKKEELEQLIEQRKKLDEQIKEIKASEQMQNDLIGIKKAYNVNDDFMYYTIQVKKNWKGSHGQHRFFPIADVETAREAVDALNQMIELIEKLKIEFIENARRYEWK